MKRFFKSFAAALLIVMTMSCMVFADVNLNIKVRGSEVTIDGSSSHAKQSVMIETWSGDKKYYIDAGSTDDNGNFKFKFNTAQDIDYSGEVNVGGELKELSFSTKASVQEVKVQSLKLDANSLQLEEGKSTTLHASLQPENATNKKVIWKSSDASIAAVEQNGTVKAVKQGSATITATSEDGNYSDTCVVTVISSIVPPTPSAKEVSVYIRVEGYDSTLIPREKINVGLFDLTPYLATATGSSAKHSNGWGVDKFKSPTNAHAIVQALKDHGVNYDFQDYGWSLYIAMIGGDREFDQGPMSGWMYSVNGKLPPVGCQATPLHDGDDIVWFYGAYGFDTLQTTLSSNKTSVKTGEEVEFKLNGIKTDGADQKSQKGSYQQEKVQISDASILVNGSEYTINGQTVKTDSNGKAVIKFDKAGTYTISAERYRNSKRDIVKPLPLTIRVTDGGTVTPGGGTAGGGTAGGGAAGSASGAVNELQQKISEISITPSQTQITKQGDTNIATIDEKLLASKIDEVNKQIKEVEASNSGTKFGDEVKVVPIKIDEDSSLNTVLKLQTSVVKELKDKGFGLEVHFKDSCIRVPKAVVGNMDSNNSLEVVKNAVKIDTLSKVEKLLPLKDKLLSEVYDINLKKVSNDGKEEELGLAGTTISLKINPEKIKNMNKNSLKLRFYNKTTSKWSVFNAVYDGKNNVITAEIK